MIKTKLIATTGGLEELKKRLSKKSEKLNVGFLNSAKYDEGTSVAAVAYKNEFGVGVPARPFMRPAVSKNGKAWQKKYAAFLKSGMANKDALELLGEVVSGDIRKSITEVHEPPLSEYTIKKRMERRQTSERTPSIEKPLVDTGLMIGSVTSEVIEK